jgi:hypothetical protein
VQTVGAGSNGTWIRSSDGNADGEIEAGMIVMVTEGDIYKDTQWKLTTNDPIVLGTTPLVFEQNTGVPTAIANGTSNVAVTSSGGNVGVAVGGTSNVALFSTAGVDVTGRVSATGNVTGGNLTTAGVITATGNVTGGNINTSGEVRATGCVYGVELSSTQSAGSEGGQINLSIPAASTSLIGQVTIDVYQNQLRFFQGNNAKGAYIDLTAAADGVGSNLLAGGGGGTPGGSNTQVQFNDAGSFGGNAQFTYNKTTNSLTVGNVYTSSNGAGTNLRVGDDAWIGDINVADTIGIRGQQNSANAYIVFGNADATALGRAGSGPLTYAGAFSVTGNINSSANIVATANVIGGNLSTAGVISATGSITTAGDISITGNIVDGAALTVTTSSNGNITFNPNGSGVVVFNKDLRNGQANGVGNIGTTGGFFNTVFAKATSAQYADVAEKYVADQIYPPGTVLEIGGSAEVQATTHYASTHIAGVVSSHPALIMNSGETSANSVEVALLGRVPCRVIGLIQRGDLLVSSRVVGVATVLDPDQYRPGCVIGKALQDHHDTGEGMIEVLVGRL